MFPYPHLLVALLAATLTPLAAVAADAGPQTQVYLAPGEIVYAGPLTTEANARAFALFDAQANKPVTLSMYSPGGNTDVGMELGNWVRKNNLTVKVLEMCFSSCANYVFTAAKKKVVSNFAIVGYHGGLSSMTFELDPSNEAVLAALPSGEREAARAKLMDDIRQWTAPQIAREKRYFDAIGVQQRITTLGQAEACRKLALADENSIGWSYTVEGFAKLGVADITVVNPPWRPRSISSPRTVRTVDVD